MRQAAERYLTEIWPARGESAGTQAGVPGPDDVGESPDAAADQPGLRRAGGLFHSDEHYGSDEEYIAALADAIHEAGLVLQLDCPDLAMGWNVAGTLWA